jgi:hypothetical protein
MEASRPRDNLSNIFARPLLLELNAKAQLNVLFLKKAFEYPSKKIVEFSPL